MAFDGGIVSQAGNKYTNITASALINGGKTRIKGIFVAVASSTPTIKVWDNTSAATTVLVNTFTPVAATWYEFGDAIANTGVFVTISGTVDCTVMWEVR